MTSNAFVALTLIGVLASSLGCSSTQMKSMARQVSKALDDGSDTKSKPKKTAGKKPIKGKKVASTGSGANATSQSSTSLGSTAKASVGPRCDEACAKAKRFSSRVPNVVDMRRCNQSCPDVVSKSLATCLAEAKTRYQFDLCSLEGQKTHGSAGAAQGSKGYAAPVSPGVGLTDGAHQTQATLPTRGAVNATIRVTKAYVYPAKASGNCWDAGCGDQAAAIAQVMGVLTTAMTKSLDKAATGSLSNKFVEETAKIVLANIAQPDPWVQMCVRDKCVKGAKVQDTLVPQWSESLSVPLQAGDLIHLWFWDKDLANDDPIWAHSVLVTQEALDKGELIIKPESEQDLPEFKQLYMAVVAFR